LKRCALEISDMRRMKSRAARTTPTETATTMSKMTVRPKQVSRTVTSLRGATRRMWVKCFISLMFQATTSRRAAMEAMGSQASSGASVRTAARRKERVKDGGEGGARAGADGGGGAGDGAGGGDTAEEGDDEVAQPLGDEFAVGIVFGAGHAIGDDGAEQGLDGAEDGDGEGGTGEGAEERWRVRGVGRRGRGGSREAAAEAAWGGCRRRCGRRACS
jgi:hypothetical protein